MFRPDRPSRPFVSAAVAVPATPVRPAAGARTGAVFANLHREIGDAVKHGFGPSQSNGALASQAAQLARAYRAHTTSAPTMPGGIRAGEAALDALAGAGSLGASRQAFIDDILPHARHAASTLGTSPDIVAAHAALESGWGQRPLRNARGDTTHNLFGIKATGGWRGATADSTTTEYVNGTAIRTVEAFRAYPNYAGAFRDYAHLLTSSPRYAEALNVGDDARAFARALKRGGYATDPDYDAKLVSVVEQIRGIER
jgi:peptidoglycan hydrolase FlgJ